MTVDCNVKITSARSSSPTPPNNGVCWIALVFLYIVTLRKEAVVGRREGLERKIWPTSPYIREKSISTTISPIFYPFPKSDDDEFGIVG